jgi:copper chaperone
METLQFKTNIKCSGCLEKVTPELDRTVGHNSWKVDIVNPDKILTVSAESVDETKIRSAVEKAGFKAEKIS